MTHAMLDDIEQALRIGDRDTDIWNRAKAAVKQLRSALASPQPSEDEVERVTRALIWAPQNRKDQALAAISAMSPRPQVGMISADRACEIVGYLIESGGPVPSRDIREAINTIRMEAGTGDALSEYVRGYDVGKKVAADDLIAFLAMWATTYQRDYGLDGLHPIHFDLLEKYGARMVDFKRATIPEPRKE